MTIEALIASMQANRANRKVLSYASDRTYALLDEVLRLRSAMAGQAPVERIAFGTAVSIAHDGFSGTVQGHYVTREGKPGVVLQQHGTRVVHVYGEKWLRGETG